MNCVTFASMFGICCVLVAMVPALQGCDKASEPELTDGDLAQLATSDVALVEDGQLWNNLEQLVTDQSASAQSGAVTKLQEAIGVQFFIPGASAVVKVEDEKLKINMAMSPISLLDGLIAMQRAEDNAELGPVLVLEIPLSGDTLSPVAAAQNLLEATWAHIEGHIRVSELLTGSFRLLMNREGFRFYLEMQLKFFAIEAQSTLRITDTNEAHLAGELSLKFDEELGKKISDLINQAAAPAVNTLRSVWEVLENVKNQCSSCDGCGLLDFSCKRQCCILFKAGLDVAEAAFNLAKGTVGAVADIAVSILELAGDVFSIHSVKFDLLLEKQLSANLEVAIDATVLGKRRTTTLTINLENLDESALKVARDFVPELNSP